MPLSERQITAFVEKHLSKILYDTSPRHLAGPGDARHVTHGLAAAGWSTASDPLSPEIVLRSPDGRLHLQLDPQSDTSAFWRLWAEPTEHDPGWYAEFGEFVPAEVLADLTDALVASTPAEATSPLAVLDAAGWLIDGRGAADSDPAGCRVERRPEHGWGTLPWREQGRAAWQIDVREHLGRIALGPRLWHAFFSGPTPEHLVSAFVAALADHAPLQRGGFERTAQHGVTQDQSHIAPQQMVDAYTSRITSLRARTRSTRRQHRNPPPPAKDGPARPSVRR